MAKAKKFELNSPAPILDEEDEKTLAAIDEGLRDAKAGRTIPAEEVRKRLPKWITASSTRQGRCGDLAENIDRIAENCRKPQCLFGRVLVFENRNSRSILKACQ